MHMQGEPRTMQKEPQYEDVVAEVTQFLRERVAQCVQAGLGRELIIVDPGFGFGKRPAHNVELLARLSQVTEIGVPVLVGISRKSTLGKITGKDVSQLMPASIAAAVLAVQQGAQIVRAHDIAETVDALRVAAAVMNSGSSK
jgi:dihydropteroate synthase